MSFGFSVSDFISLAELARKVWKEFAGAPDQLRDITQEVRSLSIILDDVEFGLSGHNLDERQEGRIRHVSTACREVLEDLEKTLDIYSELGSKKGSLGRRLKRSWKRLSWEPDDIRDLRNRVTSNITMLNTSLQAISSHVIVATREGVDRLNWRQDNQEQLAILGWLIASEHGPQQQDLINRREPGTGQWLLESEEYRAWREADGQTLFCPGIPGAGKTMTTAIVVDDLAGRGGRFPETGIAYVYCNFRRQDEQPGRLLAALLKQLSWGWPHLPDGVKALYDTHSGKGTQPSVRELSETLQSVAAAYSRVFIAIDALDECQPSPDGRGELLGEVFALQAKTGANIFTTSRPIPEITFTFKGLVSLEIRATEEDVRRYVRGHIDQLPKFVRDRPELQVEVEDRVAQSTQGMFLLAQLHLNSLVGKVSLKALRRSLADLPTGTSAYDRVYKSAMDRIRGQVKDQEELAMQVLLWITCASRPLTVLELRHALAVEISEPDLDQENLPEVEDMVSACAGLVTIDEQSDVIRLVHYTAQQYFEQTREVWFPDAETRITATCATYLSFTVFKSGPCRTRKEFEERQRSNPLYKYAACNWGHHARKATTFHLQVLSFLTFSSKVQAARQVAAVNIEDWELISGLRLEPRTLGLHMAYLGVFQAVEALLQAWQPDERNQEKGAYVDARDDFGDTALLLAVAMGHEAVVELLLEHGASPTLGDSIGVTPLLRAAREGDESIVKALLEKGANPNGGNHDGATPLMWAAGRGHSAIIEMLIEKGANVERKDRHGNTPLLSAVRGWKKMAMVALLEKNANPSTADYSQQTPLSLAVEGNNEEFVRMLLGKGAGTEATDNQGRTPLLGAIIHGRDGIAETLLEHGADPEAKDRHGRTPLCWAMSTHKEYLVKMLLEKGADPHIKGSGGQTPLLWAARGSHDALVEILLGLGADPNAQDGSGGTSLLAATRTRSTKIVRMLVESGADLEAEDPYYYGYTPLSLAVERGHEDIVKMLLEKGANVNAKHRAGDTPLSLAFRKKNEGLAKLLLGTGADANAEDGFGVALLLRAAFDGHEVFVNLLLEQGADTEAHGRHGRTPLLEAAFRGHEAVVNMLIENGANIRARDPGGRTAVWWAAKCGHEGVVRILVAMLREYAPM